MKPSKPYEPGEIVAEYRIDKLLGEGGFGEAYLAYHERLKRRVVIKTLKADFKNKVEGDGRAADAQRRFKVEAEAQTRLSHPNVCAVYDVLEEHWAIVMEFVDGETLEEWSKTKPSRESIVTALTSAAQALRHAHSNKVAHRDLTLKNVMISREGFIKVLDFGLAKFIDNDETLSGFSKLCGTPGYVAPERWTDPMADDQTIDIFSFGVLIYKLITGELPFPGIVGDNPPAFKDFDVPDWRDLEDLARRCLTREPKARPTVDEMIDALGKIHGKLQHIPRDICFFDSSTLLEILSPGTGSGEAGTRRKRARYYFRTHMVQNSAVSSPGALAELADAVCRQYFELRGGNSGTKSPLYRFVERFRIEMLKQSNQPAKTVKGPARWDKLTDDQRHLFFIRAKPFFAEQLYRLARQLAVAAYDSGLYVKGLDEFSRDPKVSRRAVHRLAEAVAAGGSHIASELPEYRRPEWRKFLKKEFIGTKESKGKYRIVPEAA